MTYSSRNRTIADRVNIAFNTGREAKFYDDADTEYEFTPEGIRNWLRYDSAVVYPETYGAISNEAGATGTVAEALVNTVALKAAMESGYIVDGGNRTYNIARQLTPTSISLRPTSLTGLKDIHFKQITPQLAIAPDIDAAGLRSLDFRDLGNFTLQNVSLDQGGLINDRGINTNYLSSNGGFFFEGCYNFTIDGIEITNSVPGAAIAFEDCADYYMFNFNIVNGSWTTSTTITNDIVQGVITTGCKRFIYSIGSIRDFVGNNNGTATLRYSRAMPIGGSTNFSISDVNITNMDQAFDCTGSYGCTDFTITNCHVSHINAWGFKNSNNTRDGVYTNCSAYMTGVGGFNVQPSNTSGLEQWRVTQNLTFDNCLSHNPGGRTEVLPTGPGWAAFYILGGLAEYASYPQGIRLINCRAVDDRGPRNHQPVVVASTANGTLATAFANGQVMDGVTLVTNMRILLKDQTDATENGIYLVTVGAPTRTTDADAGSDIFLASVFVHLGTVNANTVWANSNYTEVTLGSNPFSVTTGSTTITTTWTAHGLSVNDTIVISNAFPVSGIPLNGRWRVLTVPTANTFTFEAIDYARTTTTGGGDAAVIVNASPVVGTANLTFTKIINNDTTVAATVGGALMTYGAYNVTPHDGSPLFRRNELINFKSVGHTIAHDTGFHHARVIVNASAVQSHDSGSATYDEVLWTSEVEDTSNMRNTGIAISQGIITCVESGKYLFRLRLPFAANSTGLRGAKIQFLSTFHSGAVIDEVYVNNVGASLETVVHLSTTYDLVAGDQFSVYGYQASGGDLNMLADRRFEVTKIGP